VHVTDLDRLKGYELGAVDYVYVPVVPEILRGKVQVLVELYRQRRELERLNRSLAEANAALQAEKARELDASASQRGARAGEPHAPGRDRRTRESAGGA
jgi:DNA-binding response OmpR family regulator